MPRSGARLAVGLVVLATASGLGAATWGGAVGLPDVGALRGRDVGLAVAGALFLVGSALLLWRGREASGPAPSVPAHVAFVTRNNPVPATPAPPPRRPPKPAFERPDAYASELKRIDKEIREVTREINKAGVMLATGRLSNEGYQAYVEELKQRRGALESSRVSFELGRKH